MHRSRVFVLCAVVACTAVLAAQAPAPQPVDLLITGGTVVTVDASRRVLTPGRRGDSRRATSSPWARPDAVAARTVPTRVIDATGRVVMPGLINTHGHAPMVMYRGLADDLALMDWLQQYIFPAEAKTVAPAFVRAGTELAALEMIRSGTTTYTDMYYFEEEIARVTKAAGLRGVLGETVIGFPSPDAKTPADALARTERFIQEFQDDPLITPAVAPHSMYLAGQGRPARVPRARAEVRQAAAHPPRRDRGRDQDVARAPPRDARPSTCSRSASGARRSSPRTACG